MNAALSDLYREVIREHSQRPRNYRALPAPAAAAEAYNPLCGDRLTVYVELTDGVVCNVTFQGQGCALATASASMMTEVLLGSTRRAVSEIGDAFTAMAKGSALPAPMPNVLTAFAGVRSFPSRVKCTLLPWEALRAALRLTD